MPRRLNSIKGAASQLSTPALKCLLLVPAAASLGLLASTSAISQELLSSEDEDRVSAEELEVTTSAEVLRIDPLFRVGVNTESGGTPTSLNAFDGFFPLLQTPGNNVTYLNTRLNIDFDEESTLSGTVLFGHRSYSSDRERILGGYVAIDARDTGEATFPQVGFGFERLGKYWDIRANGYVPVGDTRQRVERDVFNSSETSIFVNEPAFTGNILARTADITTSNIRTQVDRFEEALGGFDVEAGTRLARWKEHGELRLYGGIYYLGGEDVSEVGGRGRIEIVPVKSIRLMGGIQGDALFDVRGFFGASFLFPAPEPLRKDIDPDEKAEAIAALGETVTRLADPVARNYSVVVNEEDEVETTVTTTTTSEDVPFINPETGDPWRFTHVALGGSSDGTFEDPFALLQDGLDATVGDGNDIVYVALADDTEVAPFTIPDNVQVLSTGPVQELDGSFAGISETVVLPGSNDGNFPDVTGRVTLGNNTTLSGFEFIGTTGPAIRGPDGLMGIVRVSDNILSNIQGNGIQVGAINSDPEFRITNNTIEGVGANGIAFASEAANPISLTDNSSARIIITDNTIADSAENGVLFADIQGDANAEKIEISNNTIINSGTAGIGFGLIEGDAVVDIEILDNTLMTPAEDGILFSTFSGDTESTIAIEANTISDTSDDGIDFSGSALGSDDPVFVDNAFANITISDNIISNVDDGIEFDDFENDADVTLTIENNVISDSDNGIEFDDFQDDVIANILISGNRISDSSQNGIEIEDVEDNADFTLDIVDNEITNIGILGIQIDTIQDDAVATVNISANNISNTGNDGINVDPDGPSEVDLTISNNTIQSTGTEGIDIDNTSENTTITAIANELSNNGTTGLQVINLPAGKVCLLLTENMGTNVGVTDYTLTNNAPLPTDFEIVDLGNIANNNMGSFEFNPSIANFDSVTSCTP